MKKIRTIFLIKAFISLLLSIAATVVFAKIFNDDGYKLATSFAVYVLLWIYLRFLVVKIGRLECPSCKTKLSECPHYILYILFLPKCGICGYRY